MVVCLYLLFVTIRVNSHLLRKHTLEQVLDFTCDKAVREIPLQVRLDPGPDCCKFGSPSTRRCHHSLEIALPAAPARHFPVKALLFRDCQSVRQVSPCPGRCYAGPSFHSFTLRAQGATSGRGGEFCNRVWRCQHRHRQLADPSAPHCVAKAVLLFHRTKM